MNAQETSREKTSPKERQKNEVECRLQRSDDWLSERKWRDWEEQNVSWNEVVSTTERWQIHAGCKCATLQSRQSSWPSSSSSSVRPNGQQGHTTATLGGNRYPRTWQTTSSANHGSFCSYTASLYDGWIVYVRWTTAFYGTHWSSQIIHLLLCDATTCHNLWLVDQSTETPKAKMPRLQLLYSGIKNAAIQLIMSNVQQFVTSCTSLCPVCAQQVHRPTAVSVVGAAHREVYK